MGRVDKSNGRWILLLVAFLTMLSLVTFANAAPAHAAGSSDPGTFEGCLLKKVNQARAAGGVGPVQMAGGLVPQVRDWSKWMRFNDFQHMPTPRRLAILPTSRVVWGENIAMHGNHQMADCGPIHTLWMNSPGHRANMLSPRFRFVAIGTYHDNSGWWATQLFLDKCGEPCVDEMFFYRADGLFRYYGMNRDGSLGSPISSGSGYSKGWDTITAVDLDGDGQDEMLFYKKDGTYRYYDVNRDGSLGSPISSGSGYSKGWDTITAVDLDGDGTDEMFFYRDDGLYRYYDVRPDGRLSSPIRAGNDYTKGWISITAVDLDGDGTDEMFFYRDDGLYRYYDVRPDGRLSSPIRAGKDYTKGWDSITAVDFR